MKKKTVSDFLFESGKYQLVKCGGNEDRWHEVVAYGFVTADQRKVIVSKLTSPEQVVELPDGDYFFCQIYIEDKEHLSGSARFANDATRFSPMLDEFDFRKWPHSNHPIKNPREYIINKINEWAVAYKALSNNWENFSIVAGEKEKREQFLTTPVTVNGIEISHSELISFWECDSYIFNVNGVEITLYDVAIHCEDFSVPMPQALSLVAEVLEETKKFLESTKVKSLSLCK